MTCEELSIQLYISLRKNTAGSGTILKSQKVQSVVDCSSLCQLTPNCAGANFHEENNECEMLDIRGSAVVERTSPGLVYSCCSCSDSGMAHLTG